MKKRNQNQNQVLTRMYALSVALFFSASTYADIPSGYYNTVNTSSASALKASLHEIIDDHQRFPYTSSSTDTWDILESADQDPNNASNVIDVYKNASYPKAGGGNSFYNREHSWPKSYGFPKDGSSNYAYTDAHHLFIADSSYNSSRSNKPYDNCSSCDEKVTLSNNGRGGTNNDSNWTTGSFTQGSWQTWNGRKGDVARALMYMAVRYEGGTHGVTGVSEPDLILTDDRTLIQNSNAGSNISVAYMGLKSVLIQWHKDDPVDAFEHRHNEIVFSHQGNRNPFIDHPEYVACVFEGICNGSGDSTPPAVPTGLLASGGNSEVTLTWSPNNDTDLAGYNVYRSDSASGTYIRINNSLHTTTSFTNSSLASNTTYFYKVTAVDSSNNESATSSTVNATTNNSTTPTEEVVWINELHYDNDGTDTNEFVELAGSAGAELNGWKLVAYNGNGGTEYKTVSLSGSIPNQYNNWGVLAFDFSGLQNGAPDGIALIDNKGSVVQFISYEGTMTATNGAASGQTSSDIGVSESTTTSVGYSLQLTGSGKQYSSFNWLSPTNNTKGVINSGQSFTGSVPTNQAPQANYTYTCNGLTCQFDGSTSTDSDGSITLFNWQFGDSSNKAGNPIEHTYTNAGSYNVTLTVTDNAGATSQHTAVIEVVAPKVIPWINELHYDNSGSDKNERVEIAGSAGTNLSGWKIEAYNGNDGKLYKTFSLSGVIDNEQNGFGALSFRTKGLQNGSADGIALINDLGEVVQFLSYEGTLTATNGTANGLTSTDIGISETGSTSSSSSLQLYGNGSKYEDFQWRSNSASAGNLNSSQTIN